MSIKTVGQETQSNTVGLKKKINDGAEKLVFDILQQTQYSTPIPSTVRELVTNACDAQREKEIAIEILRDGVDPSKYYINRDGEEYADSNFDPSYYDLDYLHTEKNHVLVEYKEDKNGSGFCDTFSVTDYGVGIGKRRLEGMLELGYSTKRNTSENFGAFGLGSKVALSTGVPFYTVETVYNGKLFKFNCYPYKTDFVIGKFEADGSVELSNGTKAYYQDTLKINQTTVSFGVKKHNRRAFRNAVTEQLTYFSNVRFRYHYEDGFFVEDLHPPKIVLNNEHLIVTDSSTYARPHIIMVKRPGDEIGINYGSIDFRELELEQKYGSVGIKCPARQAYIKDGEEIVIQEGVDVTPSREKVIWNQNTKDFVLKAFEKAVESANEVIQDKLKQEEFVDWLRACKDVLYVNSIGEENSTLLKNLGGVVDKSKIKPKFKDTNVRFESPSKMLTNVRLRRIGYSETKGVIREEVTDWTTVNFDRLFFTKGSVNKYKDAYLGNPIPFFLVSFKAPEDTEEEPFDMYSLFVESPSVKNYDEVEYPSGYENQVDNAEQKKELTPAELRKLQQKVVGYSLRHNRYGEAIWDKYEPKIQTVLESETPTFYGTRKEDGYKLKLAADILKSRTPQWRKFMLHHQDHFDRYYSFVFFMDEHPTYQDVLNADIKHDGVQLFALAENNIKYAEQNSHWRHIDEFFFEPTDDGSIVVGEYVRPYMDYKVYGRVNSWLKNVTFADQIFPDVTKTIKKLEDYLFSAAFYGNKIKDDEERENYNRLLNYLNNLALHSVDSQQDGVSLTERSQERFIVDIGKITCHTVEFKAFFDALDALNEDVADFMTDIHSTRKLDIVKIILDHFNKFDIEFPEIEVPEVQFNLTPQVNQN